MHHLHGVTTTQALIDSGISEGQLSRRTEYERLATGHYALPGARRDFWFYAALALSVAGLDARLTSHSALLAMEVLTQRKHPVQIAVPEGKGSRKQRGFDVRRGLHLPDTVVVRHGLRMVPMTYALTDFARDARDGELAYAISRAMGTRSTSLDALSAVAAERGRYPGSARLRRVLGDFEGTESHSKSERVLRRELARVGLSDAVAQHQVRDAAGNLLASIDFALPDLKLAIELDGPHHFSVEQQERDRRRDRQLRARGWTTIRITVYELDANPRAVVAEILGLVNQLRREAEAA